MGRLEGWYRRKFFRVGEGYSLRRSRYPQALFWPEEVDAYIANVRHEWLNPLNWTLLLCIGIGYPLTAWIEGSGFSATPFPLILAVHGFSNLFHAYRFPFRVARARALDRWEPELDERRDEKRWWQSLVPALSILALVLYFGWELGDDQPYSRWVFAPLALWSLVEATRPLWRWKRSGPISA